MRAGPGNDVQISLTSDEALVLYDWLHRSEQQDAHASVEHHAEQVALWNLTALLERELVEPFDPRYDELVREARARLSR